MGFMDEKDGKILLKKIEGVEPIRTAALPIEIET